MMPWCLCLQGEHHCCKAVTGQLVAGDMTKAAHHNIFTQYLSSVIVSLRLCGVAIGLVPFESASASLSPLTLVAMMAVMAVTLRAQQPAVAPLFAQHPSVTFGKYEVSNVLKRQEMCSSIMEAPSFAPNTKISAFLSRKKHNEASNPDKENSRAPVLLSPLAKLLRMLKVRSGHYLLRDFFVSTCLLYLYLLCILVFVLFFNSWR